MELKLISCMPNPKRGNQTLSIRIRVDTFFMFSRHPNENIFLIKWHFPNGIKAYLLYAEPEGGKPSALCQNPGSPHFSCFLDILWKNVLPTKWCFSIELDLISGMPNPKGANQVLSIRIWGRHIFHVFSTSYEKTFYLQNDVFQSN